MQHDTPLLHYVAFLVDRHGFVPYRDVFETSMPGTILLHMAIGKLVGYSDAAFRAIDIACLVILLATTWLLLKPFATAVGVASALVFGLLYFGHGPAMSLQRDYLGILPIALALLVVTRRGTSSCSSGIAGLVGALFALSASIKPQLAIGLPAVIAYICLPPSVDWRRAKLIYARRVLWTAFNAVCCFVIVASVPFVWLWSKGGLAAFQDMFLSYLPLHIQLSGDHRMLSDSAQWEYVLDHYGRLGGYAALSILAVLAAGRAVWILKDPAKIRFVLLLGTLTALYACYPVLSRQFWDYHWMPFAYFVTVSASLALVPAPAGRFSSLGRLAGVVALLLCFAHAKPAEVLAHQMLGATRISLKTSRVDEIAGFLQANLRHGDKVQTLDWTGGAVHGMLAAEAVVATPYIYDYHFYHHVSRPYIAELRKRFIGRLEAQPPRFIIEVFDKPRPHGFDTATEFVELRSFIDSRYVTVYGGQGFVVFERAR